MDYFNIYKDVWAFHKKYIDKISDGKDFWREVMAECEIISKKYGRSKFVVNLLMNENSEFERLQSEVTSNK